MSVQLFKPYLMPIWDALFGRSVTPAERLRQHLRSLQRAQRELERERVKLEQQEKKLLTDIKRNAAQGQMAACKVMARDLVRTRRSIHKFYQMKTQLQAVGLRMQTLRSTQQMAEAMRGASRSLGTMNKSMNIVAVQRILQEFERESSAMDMKDEIMNDTIEDALGTEEDAMGEGVGEGEESDAILREVMDEIGLNMNQQVRFSHTLTLQLKQVPDGVMSPTASSTPARVPIGEAPVAGPVAANDDMALQARLDRLRKGA